MNIHQNLRQLRQMTGLTQQQAAEQVGITRQALSGYESGRRPTWKCWNGWLIYTIPT